MYFARVLTVLSATALFALPTPHPGPARLVKDINTTPVTETRTDRSTFFRGAAAIGDRLLFVADDAVHGQEAWITDGTEAGTRLVKEINPGPGDLFPSLDGNWGFFEWSGRAYFTANDGVHGFELWVTDGTEGGTRLVKDISPGAASSYPMEYAALDSALLFVASDDVHGYALWATDGTEGGTRIVKEMGALGVSLGTFVRLGDLLYFLRGQEDGLLSLWRTDGTEAGTFQVSAGGDFFERPAVYKGAIWFINGDGTGPASLWRSDGTMGGTVLVGEVGAPIAFNLTVAGDTLFFCGGGDTDGAEIWATDGTPSGTRRVKDIYPGHFSSGPGNLRALGDTLLFTATDPVHGRELWRSDGTEQGTVIVKEILPGPYTGTGPSELRVVDGMLLFSADDDIHGVEPWRSDGTESGTYPVQDLLPGLEGSDPRVYTQFGNRIGFVATHDEAGREPWVARAAILTGQPVRAVRDLADEVRALRLPTRIARSLIVKLNAAARALERPHGDRTALRLLDAFILELRDRTPPISHEQARGLLEFARDIRTLLRADGLRSSVGE